MIKSRGLTKVVSNAEMERAEKASAKEKQDAMKPVITALSAHVRSVWERNKRAKLDIDTKLEKSSRQRNCIYDPTLLTAIQSAGGSEAYLGITAKKCSDTKAWILDILLPSGGGKPFEVVPTPLPDLPQDIVAAAEERVRQMAIQQALSMESQTGQPADIVAINGILKAAKTLMAKHLAQALDDEAESTAEKMEELIEDQFREGSFYKALVEVVDDFVTFNAAVMKGPVLKNKKVRKWVQGPTGYEPKVVTEIVKEWVRVSPYDIFPDPDAEDCNSGNFIEKHKLTRRDFTEMLGVPGYKDEAIREVLRRYSDKGFHEWMTTDSARAEGENRQFAVGFDTETISVVEMWGSVPGSKLIDWGMSKNLDSDMEYEVNAWIVADIVFRAVINPDPLGRRPYGKACFQTIPGAFWGRSLPENIEDDQTMCNAAARAIQNNMGLSSGPMGEYDADRCPTYSGQITPWLMIASTNKQMAEGSAIKFHNIPNNSESLIRVYDKFSLLADEHSGIPAYQQGNTANVGGAGSTASGLDMLMKASSRGVMGVVRSLDDGIIQPILDMAIDHNMQYHPDESVKGDIKAYAIGTSALAIKQQAAIRRMEFATATNNPIDYALMGPSGRKELLKGVADAQDLPVDKIFPDDPMPQAPMQTLIPGQTPAPENLDAAGNKAGGQANLMRAQ